MSCNENESATNSQEDEELVADDIPCNPSSEVQIEVVPLGNFIAKRANETIVIDGCSIDASWSDASWYDLNYTWMGSKPNSSDYSGKFKVLWDESFLYLYVAVVDDSLSATLANGIDNYWKGDYVEIFLDEDQSGGDHKYNHQAFAYHVSTEGHAIDKNTLEETVFFDDHIEVSRTRVGNTHYWEMAISIYDSQFDEESSDNTPVKLTSQKTMGFSLAYGDNDGNNSRENFMGSRETHGTNNDEGYINSDVFGSVLLEQE